MANLVAGLVTLIFNWSPILHVSNDEYFGSPKYGVNRISLLSLWCGPYKLYFFSLVRADEVFSFEFFRLLRFSELRSIHTLSDIDKKTEDYRSNISGRGEVEVQVMVDFLMHKLTLSKARSASAYNKTNAYMAITLVYIGFIAYLIDRVVGSELVPQLTTMLKLGLYVFLGFSVYFLINAALFIQRTLTIRGYVQSKFSSVKANADCREAACGYYTDWYSSDNESLVLTSMLANVEHCFTRSLISAIFVWLGLFGAQYYNGEGLVVSKNLDEYLLFDESGRFQEGQAEDLMRTLNQGRGKLYLISKSGNSNAIIVKHGE